MDTLFLNKIAEKRYVSLRRNIIKEEQKHQIYTDRLLLIDELNESLINRVFQITKDFILIQKLVFGKHSN